MTTQTFQNVDAAKWQRVKDQLVAKANITIASDTGQAEARGIDISWSYDATAATLTVTLVSREWFDPSEQVIDTDISQWITAA
jgi:hypothetical protein